jgi:hypothetical protein
MDVRTLLLVAVIVTGILNIRLHHPWHRMLGAVAIAVGVVLFVLIWLL